jgi:type I restriction enzyme S subunit
MSSGISSKPEQAGHGATFLSFSSVFTGHFLPETLPDRMDTSEKEQKNYSVKKGDIFLTRTSETIDELGMSSVAHKDYPKATYSGFLKRLRPLQTDKSYHKFMAFYLRSPLFRKAMNNNAVMTLRCSLNEQIFSYLDILLPEFNEQIKIGDLLYLIHTKIALNNRINTELEGMAKLLYDYWFVQFDFPMTAAQAASLGRPDLEGHPYKSSGGKMVFNPTLKREIPDGWEVKPLEQIEDHIVTGKTPPTTDPKNFGGDIPFICIGDVRGNMHVIETQLTLSKVGAELQTKKFIPKGAICVTCIASPGLIAFATKDSQTNQQLNSIVCKNEENRMFLYFYLGDYFKHAAGAKTGNTFANMNKGDFSEINVLLPDQGLLTQFMEKVSSSESQILNHLNQNQELTELRDWLLPMLMNGQLTVG